MSACVAVPVETHPVTMATATLSLHASCRLTYMEVECVSYFLFIGQYYVNSVY